MNGLSFVSTLLRERRESPLSVSDGFFDEASEVYTHWSKSQTAVCSSKIPAVMGSLTLRSTFADLGGGVGARVGTSFGRRDWWIPFEEGLRIVRK